MGPQASEGEIRQLETQNGLCPPGGLQPPTAGHLIKLLLALLREAIEAERKAKFRGVGEQVVKLSDEPWAVLAVVLHQQKDNRRALLLGQLKPTPLLSHTARPRLAQGGPYA